MRPIATLGLSPGDFAERWNLVMRPGRSNLGDSVGALLQTEPDHRQFALLHHLEATTEGPEVELLAPEQDDPRDAVERFLSAFELSENLIRWSSVPRRGLRAS
jgi:hypothetical protein